MAQAIATNDSILRVVSNSELDRMEAEETALENEVDEEEEQDLTGLAGFVRQEYYRFRDEYFNSRMEQRLLAALQSFNGQYTAQKLAEIQKFGGSEVYSRISATKCRGATALLKDVFLGGERPWELGPTPVPELPDDIRSSVEKLLQVELMTMAQGGQQVPMEQVNERRDGLYKAAQRAAVKNARDEAREATRQLEDILVEGGFYEALAEFLIDLPVFPYAVLKGPVVVNKSKLNWQPDGSITTETVPTMTWTRVSPFDILWTPGASRIKDAATIERVKLTRADLDALIGVPGYNEDAIRDALQMYGQSGLNDWVNSTDTERAILENKETPSRNVSNLIDSLEYNGPIQGKMLLDNGVKKELIDDPDKDYFATVWMIGGYVIKAQILPNPQKRSPYYISSFEKVPGSIAGNGLIDIIQDVQDVCNATLRSLVNNLSISSGPQVVVLTDRFAPNQNTDDLYPWKRWRMLTDPYGNNQPPIQFYQPKSNAQELLQVYDRFTVIADENSAIPRYMTGSSRVGGAGRTASGLSMLMQSSSKVLQSVAANIDVDVMSPLMQSLYNTVMLTDKTGMLRGDEKIVVKGVTVATQKETERMRKLEMLQITANPIDQQIIGMKGRANILRSLSQDLGMDGETIVPTDEELKAMQEQQQAAMMAAQAQGVPAPNENPERQGQAVEGMSQVRPMADGGVVEPLPYSDDSQAGTASSPETLASTADIPTGPLTINLNIDGNRKDTKKRITLNRGEDGNFEVADVYETQVDDAEFEDI